MLIDYDGNNFKRHGEISRVITKRTGIAFITSKHKKKSTEPQKNNLKEGWKVEKKKQRIRRDKKHKMCFKFIVLYFRSHITFFHIVWICFTVLILIS